MAEYRNKAGNKSGAGNEKHTAVGGVLMGQKGREVLEGKQEESRRLV